MGTAPCQKALIASLYLIFTIGAYANTSIFVALCPILTVPLQFPQTHASANGLPNTYCAVV